MDSYLQDQVLDIVMVIGTEFYITIYVEMYKGFIFHGRQGFNFY